MLTGYEKISLPSRRWYRTSFKFFRLALLWVKSPQPTSLLPKSSIQNYTPAKTSCYAFGDSFGQEAVKISPHSFTLLFVHSGNAKNDDLLFPNLLPSMLSCLKGDSENQTVSRSQYCVVVWSWYCYFYPISLPHRKLNLMICLVFTQQTFTDVRSFSLS